jgi:hypothetical protein
MQMEDAELALKKAIESGDTDLSNSFSTLLFY